jgi:hypothetical protein
MRLNKYYQHIETGKKSQHILDLIGDSITFKENLTPEEVDFWSGGFKEIREVPVMDTLPERYKELLEVVPIIDYEWDDFLKETWKVWVSVIENNWSNYKFHLIYHSSGYDSRMTSMALRELAKKNGRSWLGDILFVCFKPEDDSFKEIMKYQGWKKEQYLVYNENVDPTEYWLDGFYYDNVPLFLNGASSRPINIVGTSTCVLQSKGIIPGNEKIQIWFNQTAHILESQSLVKNFLEFINSRYHTWYSKFFSVWDAEVCDVYLSYDFLRFRLESRVEELNVKDRCQYRKELISFVDPEMVKFKRWKWPEVFDGDDWLCYRLSDKLYDQMINDYKNSWYYKNIDNDLSNCKKSFEDSTWWLKWSLGAVTNQLIKKGVDIKLERNQNV